MECSIELLNTREVGRARKERKSWCRRQAIYASRKWKRTIMMMILLYFAWCGIIPNIVYNFLHSNFFICLDPGLNRQNKFSKNFKFLYVCYPSYFFQNIRKFSTHIFIISSHSRATNYLIWDKFGRIQDNAMTCFTVFLETVKEMYHKFR